MSGRHQPEAGADSPEARGPYIVRMRGRYDEDDRLTVRVPAAYGPHDARGQAEFDHPGYVGVFVERAA